MSMPAGDSSFLPSSGFFYEPLGSDKLPPGDIMLFWVCIVVFYAGVFVTSGNLLYKSYRMIYFHDINDIFAWVDTLENRE